jgi:hypothetical protein
MERRLNENLVWFAGLLAVALSLGAAYTLKLPPKTFGIVYAAVFGALATASTLFTDASRGKATAAFATGSVVFGIAVYLIIQSALKKAGAELGSEAAGAAIGGAMGTIYGIGYFLSALIASITGVFSGRKLQQFFSRRGALSPQKAR